MESTGVCSTVTSCFFSALRSWPASMTLLPMPASQAMTSLRTSLPFIVMCLSGGRSRARSAGAGLLGGVAGVPALGGLAGALVPAARLGQPAEAEQGRADDEGDRRGGEHAGVDADPGAHAARRLREVGEDAAGRRGGDEA